MTRKKRFLVVCFLIVCVIVCLVGVAFAAVNWQASRSFREVVLDQIPRSVRRIKSDRVNHLNRHTYVLRFDIGSDDFTTLVRSGPYDEISYVEYDRGVLSYGENKLATSSIWLYEVPLGERGPAWLDLGRWTRFQAWIAEKEQPDLYNVRLLLYHEGRGEAYFIEYEMRGKWEPAPIGKEYRKAKALERAPTK